MIPKRPLSEKEFKDVFSKVTRLCVELIIKAPGGIVLSLRNLPAWRGKWHIPGGTVLYKEKIMDAIARVAAEELGIRVRPEKILGYIEYDEEKEKGFGYTITLPFLCSTDQIEFKHNEEALEVKIFKEMPSNIIEEQRKFLEPIWSKIVDDRLD